MLLVSLKSDKQLINNHGLSNKIRFTHDFFQVYMLK